MFGMGTLGVGPDIAVQSTTTTTKPSVWDNINNALTKVVQPAANIYTQVKTAQSPGSAAAPGYTPAPYVAPGTGSSTPPPEEKPDNTKKYLLIGGAVILVGTGLYFATRKKSKK